MATSHHGSTRNYGNLPLFLPMAMRHYHRRMPKPPSQIADKYIVRLPDGMRDRIAEAAKANNRSMNAEIVARLEASFGTPLSAASPDVLQHLLTLAEEIQALSRRMGESHDASKQRAVQASPAKPAAKKRSPRRNKDTA
jgi:uncharacterized membrane protein YccC